MKSIVLLSLLSAVFCADPPLEWKEDWDGHHELVTRVYLDEILAIYYDNDVSRNSTWLHQYLHDVWKYTKKEYGYFGAEPSLFAIIHAEKHIGGAPVATYFDPLKLFRNVIDVGLSGANAWTRDTPGATDLVTQQIAYIVELASKQVKGNPAASILGATGWSEIYVYDIYLKLNRKRRATRWYNKSSQTVVNSPRQNTHWFRDWFYPIYKHHGGAKALARYFKLLSEYFPKANTASNNRPEYSRQLNIGEFIHFWSGAAQSDLKSLARTAFGWRSQYQQQLNQAKKDFPHIHY